ncbi:glycosyltransferase [Roseicella aquatilis]|uniref:Glycosyltransferase n=1 Tax=Roseicella aquatilis TaxID=2527868 RepID=A0A4R4D5L2_9PROT|nr:glycosyltransferase [Roseicella aquatilis]TCZ52614.1 glycosyltransferase [Roseicella aquatilis]
MTEQPEALDAPVAAPAWYDEGAPEVSVVILDHDRPDLTRTCLGHLWAHTAGRRYEIIVVDNGSAPENHAALRRIPGPFRLIRLEVNRFFGEGNNIGAEAARGPYLLFLNNDAFVTPGWLDPLVRQLETKPLLGGVGPRLLFPDGRVQEAGAFVTTDGHTVQVGRSGTHAPDEVEEDHIVDYCSAACFLLRRDLFLAVGGFDPAYEPAYYEDVDLCLRIAARGLFIGYCAGSQVVHIANATSSVQEATLGLSRAVEINRVQLLRTWGETLAAREHAALAPTPALRRGDARPRAVLYTPYDLIPGGGERYLLTAATALLRDFDVHLATEEAYSRIRLGALGRSLGLDLHGLGLVTRRELGRLGPLALSVQIGNEALPAWPGFALRNLYICQFPFPQARPDLLRRTGNLDNCAATLVYSDFVRSHLLAARAALGLADRPVEVLAPPVPPAPEGTVPAPLVPPYRIVLIGRFFTGGHDKRHDIAIEAVRRLAATGLPVRLDLIGSVLPHAAYQEHYARLLALAEGLPVTFHPNATPAVLQALLARAHLYIHATGHGVDARLHPEACEHFGISVLEAMSHGLVPFVVDNGGPAGFVQDGRNGFTYADLDGLVARITAALGAPRQFEEMRAAARATAAHFGEAAFIEAWRSRAAALLE